MTTDTKRIVRFYAHCLADALDALDTVRKSAAGDLAVMVRPTTSG